MTLACYVSLDGWLRYLEAGWRFATEPVPAPMLGHHGHYSVFMVRRGEPTKPPPWGPFERENDDG